MKQFRVHVGCFHSTDEIRRQVNEVLDSGRLSYGPKSRELEKRFAEMHGSKYGVLSNSGTSSLQVALQAMKEIHKWKDGDEVIIPAVTFVATANIVLHNKMTPVPVDVDHMTYNMDFRRIEDAITNRTRAIIPVHLFGQPAHMTMINKIAMEYDLRVIEDSCESMLATHHGDLVGSMGHIGCFSTYMAHLLTTGVGGIAITRNPVYAERMRSLVNHGRDGIYIDIDTESSPEVISRRFHFQSVGHSYRITEFEAAVGLAQLNDLREIVNTRRENAEYLSSRLNYLEGESIHLPTTAMGNTHSFMMYPIVLSNGDKNKFARYLEDNGIETREMMPLVNQPVYSDMWSEDDYPVAQWINKKGLYIGCHQDLDQDDLDHVVDVIGGYFGDESTI